MLDAAIHFEMRLFVIHKAKRKKILKKVAFHHPPKHPNIAALPTPSTHPNRRPAPSAAINL